jgi:hypothetical protein
MVPKRSGPFCRLCGVSVEYYGRLLSGRAARVSANEHPKLGGEVPPCFLELKLASL